MMTTMIAVLMVSVALVGFIPQLRKHSEYEQRLEEIRTESEEQQARLQDYRVKQERFQTDPDYVRKVAHEIGLVEPDEMIFRFYSDNASRR
jgi:cell division protein FtsB